MFESGNEGTGRLPWSVVWTLSVTQVISWGSMFYALSVLLVPIEQDLGWSRDAIIGAFSLSLLCAGLTALPVGIMIDRYGGRAVMGCGSLAAALLFALLSQVHTLTAFYAIWIGLGFAMSMTLYEPAFAVVTASFGASARRGITALTLTGGLASTVFWPLTQFMIAALGWRNALLMLALFNFLICLPLHALLLPPSPRRRSPAAQGDDTAAAPATGPALLDIVRTRAFLMLAVTFTANMLAFSALSVHLIPLLRERGFSSADAVLLAAVVGPMQVAGRIWEYTLGAGLRATQVALVALILFPLAIGILYVSGATWILVIAFIACYGVSNGVMTIVRGTITSEIFGRERYGAVNGALSAPVLASRAVGPLVASLIWTATGNYDAVIWTLAAIGLAAIGTYVLAVKI
jgi:MFS family permease